MEPKNTTDLSQTIKILIDKHGINAIEKIIDDVKQERNGNEKMLNPESRRFTILPIKYPTIWKQYMNQLGNFWTAEEIDFSGDYDDFISLNEAQQNLVKMILAFFAASDGIVNFNLSERFTKDVKITEALVAYKFQEMMENIHATVYSNMLQNIVKDEEERNRLFNAIETIDSIKRMKDWQFKWIESSEKFSQRLIAFAVVEGIFFSGVFAIIFWMKSYCKKASTNGTSKPFMEGLLKSNKFISRDEGLHVEFACELYSLLDNKLPFGEVKDIVMDGVNVSKAFMEEAMPVGLMGMNKDQMNNYIEYIADRLLVMLGYKKIYNKKNPFKFMELIGISNKTNFHESRPDEYTLSSVNNISGSDRTVKVSDDF